MTRFPLLTLVAVSILGYGASRLRAQTTLSGLGDTGKIEKVQGNFQFTEGPAKTPDGSLYFTDIPAETIFQLTADGRITPFLKPSKHANGLMFGGDNRLLACQMDGQLAAIDLTSKEVTVLADEFEGERFNACNDLTIDSVGGIYFTDPRYRAPEPWPQGKEAFYYRSKDGTVTRLGDDLTAPNGIALSPNGKTLYVVPSMQSEMMTYHVTGPGKISKGKVLCQLQQIDGEQNKGGDGLAIDTKGNLYITSGSGVQVFSPQGMLLGIIETPEHPANCAFGGQDNKTLYITARTGLYKCTMPVEGYIARKK